jgi:hypothetical protein
VRECGLPWARLAVTAQWVNAWPARNFLYLSCFLFTFFSLLTLCRGHAGRMDTPGFARSTLSHPTPDMRLTRKPLMKAFDALKKSAALAILLAAAGCQPDRCRCHVRV